MLVKEYYEEVGVVAREDRAEFEEQYFAEEAGVWLAMAEGRRWDAWHCGN